MQSRLFKRHISLFLALLFFILAFIIWYVSVFNVASSDNERSVINITNRIHKELKNLKEEGAKLKERIVKRQGHLSYSEFISEKLPYPHFIFINRELWFWSDESFSPPYEVLRGLNNFRFIQLRNGKYIAHRDAVRIGSDYYEIFIFLPLSYDYSVQNNYISSGLNEKIFNTFPFKINNTISKQGNNIYSENKDFLFSIEVPQDHDYRNEGQMLLLILIIAGGIIALYFYLYYWVLILENKNKAGWALILLALGLIAIRVGMLEVNYPFALYEYDLFNSKFFASSSVSPSLGDVLFNTIAIIIFSWYLFKNFHSTKLFKLITTTKGVSRRVVSIVIAFFSFLSLYLVYYILGVLSYHSQWSLDITSDIDFNIFRVISILIFIAIFVVYFIYSHILFRLFINLNDSSSKETTINFSAGAGLFVFYSYLFAEPLWVIVIINSIYFLILAYTNIPRAVGAIKYSTYLYFLFCALICSVTGAYSIYRQNLSESIFNKQHYANDLLFKNDVFGEFLLNEASVHISRDRFIQSRLITPLSSKDLIDYKIKRIYLPSYLDKYAVVISVFDNLGNVYDQKSNYASYFEAEGKYKKAKYKTEFPQIYFISDPETGARKYICFNEIYLDNILVGYVIIELKQKKVIPHSVYPELLVDNVNEEPYEQRNFNYAVYSGAKLLYSYGNYNYQTDFNKSWLNDSELYDEGFVNKGFHHIGLKTADGKRVVVSSEKYTFKRMFSNFSFFFLVLILFVLIFIILYALNFRINNINTTYATKIQIYLNIAFFLPLLIVSITTLSIISASYKDSLNNSFIKKAEGITSNITTYFQNNRNPNGGEIIENILMPIGRYTESDINVFNRKGRLVFTNQPMIYELGFLSRLINPEAFAYLTENTASTLMMPERIGKLKYNSVYVAIRSSENELLGILSMPFFESKNELDKQIIYVLTTIVNIFVSIFIFFLILSYFASHVLTVPLKIITQQLKKTTLEKNEPINWKTNDEIGLLVGEYNSMLVKLEESKMALSRSEKESAWREMAKQVAHEIKNPLTPMKLTIQHLQRSVENRDSDLNDKTKKALNVLLDQVNNLSEIATSFSMFAKMPIPKTQRFEISSVLAKTAALHNNNKGVDVLTSIEPGHFYVIGDEQLMSGIFTNLILNGVQSVPNGRDAEIFVKLTKSDSKVLIEVRDNGAGIPESIRDKVFLPNFSTKFAGSGIGLAVAKRGVEHAGGRIWFETEDGAGTSFLIEIPLTD